MKRVLEVLRREERMCQLQIRDMPSMAADSKEERAQQTERTAGLREKLREIEQAVQVLSRATETNAEQKTKSGAA